MDTCQGPLATDALFSITKLPPCYYQSDVKQGVRTVTRVPPLSILHRVLPSSMLRNRHSNRHTCSGKYRFISTSIWVCLVQFWAVQNFCPWKRCSCVCLLSDAVQHEPTHYTIRHMIDASSAMFGENRWRVCKAAPRRYTTDTRASSS